MSIQWYVSKWNRVEDKHLHDQRSCKEAQLVWIVLFICFVDRSRFHEVKIEADACTRIGIRGEFMLPNVFYHQKTVIMKILCRNMGIWNLIILKWLLETIWICWSDKHMVFKNEPNLAKKTWMMAMSNNHLSGIHLESILRFEVNSSVKLFYDSKVAGWSRLETTLLMIAVAQLLSISFSLHLLGHCIIRSGQWEAVLFWSIRCSSRLVLQS